MKLLDQVRDVMRRRHYSIRTEQAYVDWIKRFILFHGKRHPKDMGEKEIAQYLSYPATHRNVAASTQNQALNAIVFLYKQVLGIELGDFGHIEHAKKPKKLPVVMTKAEVSGVLAAMPEAYVLPAKLLYGCGLRLMECVRLRVKDIDFGQNQVMVRDGKGMKDRSTMLPEQLKPILSEHLRRIKLIHDKDIHDGFGDVYLPFALDRKYPKAGKEWAWQYVFPSYQLSKDPRSGKIRRHHVDESGIQKAVRRAAQTAGIVKPVTPHTFSHYAQFRIMPS